MTTALNVSAAPIQPFAIGGNALGMGWDQHAGNCRVAGSRITHRTILALP